MRTSAPDASVAGRTSLSVAADADWIQCKRSSGTAARATRKGLNETGACRMAAQ